MSRPRIITAKYFTAMVGYPPKDDDLERCNCDKAGEMFHTQCGWDYECNLPRFIVAAVRQATGNHNV